MLEETTPEVPVYSASFPIGRQTAARPEEGRGGHQPQRENSSTRPELKKRGVLCLVEGKRIKTVFRYLERAFMCKNEL